MKKRIVSLVLAFSVLLSMLPMSVLTAFAQDSILYGDADGNGKVDMSDVNLMEQYIDGDAEAQAAIHFAEADVSVDSVVNSDDVALVKEYLAGNIQLTDDLCTVSFNTDGGGRSRRSRSAETMPLCRRFPPPARREGSLSAGKRQTATTFTRPNPLQGI